MTLDASARAAAARMLAKYGKACTLNKTTAGVYNSETGTMANTTATHPVNLYLAAPNSQELAGGQALQSDEIAIFPALGLSVEPLPNDTITVNAKARTIKSVQRVWSGEQVALWRCRLES